MKADNADDLLRVGRHKFVLIHYSPREEDNTRGPSSIVNSQGKLIIILTIIIMEWKT